MSEAPAAWASLTICSIVLTGASTARFCWAGGGADGAGGPEGAGVAAKGGGGGGVRRA